MSGFVHTLCQIFTKLALFQENYDRAPNEKSKRSFRVENKMYDTNNSSNKIHELETEDDSANSSVYEKTIARFQRDFRRAASSASVKNITEVRRQHVLYLIYYYSILCIHHYNPFLIFLYFEFSQKSYCFYISS